MCVNAKSQSLAAKVRGGDIGGMWGRRSIDACSAGGVQESSSPLTPKTTRPDNDNDVGVTPRSASSWRMSIHSSSKKMTRSSKKTFEESPKSSRARLSLNSHDRLKSIVDNIPSDYESYSSSLEDLNFDSDSDLQESSKENVQSAANSLSARKKLLFGNSTKIREGSMENTRSPITRNKITPLSSPSTLRTPSDNILTVVETPPKRASHNRRSLIMKESDASPDETDKMESAKRQRQYDEESEREPRPKHSRLDIPRVRLSLFNDTSPTQVIPPKSFYSKPEQDKSKIVPAVYNDRTDYKMHIKDVMNRRRSFVTKNIRRHKQKNEINRGVRHGIRKPKHNKKNNISKERALKLSLNIIENSPLNNYLDQLTKDDKPKEVQIYDPVANLNTESDSESEISDTEETNHKKFFKTSFKKRYKQKNAVIKVNNMMIQLKNGKLFLPEKKKRRSYNIRPRQNVLELYNSMHRDVKDLVEDQIEDNPEKSAIDTLLNQWNEEEVPLSEPQTLRNNEEIHKSIENAEMLLQSRTLHMDNFNSDLSNNAVLSSIELNENESNSTTDTAYVSDTNSVQNFELLPVNGGFILVEDTEMMDMPLTTENLDSQIHEIDKNIIEIAKANNINPEILLSPTAQMCSMTSDLVLTSPKLASLNINPLLEQAKTDSNKKLYPLFDRVSNKAKAIAVDSIRIDNNFDISPNSNKKKYTYLKDQYVIDAGQKKIDATQCLECGVIYQVGDYTDEMDHQTYHSASNILKFQGWKNERFCGRWGEGRVIVIAPGDPASHWNRIYDLLERVVHPQLGYAIPLKKDKSYKIYLYIENKLIVGCLVAEILKEANKLVIDNGVQCCSTETYPVKCGISRLWTHKSYRRRGIATQMLNSMRVNFIYGHVLHCEEIAFSSPTPLGRSFAEKYLGTPNFYIYIN